MRAESHERRRRTGRITGKPQQQWDTFNDGHTDQEGDDHAARVGTLAAA